MKKKESDIFKSTKCPETSQLEKYLNSQLTKDDRHEVEMHLIDCESCSDVLEGMSQLSSKQRSDIAKKLHQSLEKKFSSNLFNSWYKIAAIIAIALIPLGIWMAISLKKEVANSQMSINSLSPNKTEEKASDSITKSNPAENTKSIAPAVSQEKNKSKKTTANKTIEINDGKSSGASMAIYKDEKAETNAKTIDVVTENITTKSIAESENAVAEEIKIDTKEKLKSEEAVKSSDLAKNSNSNQYSAVGSGYSKDTESRKKAKSEKSEGKAYDNAPSMTENKTVPAKTLFLNNQFKEAALVYEKDIKQGDNSEEKIYYCGLSWFKCMEYKKAIHWLEKLKTSSSATFKSESLWYMALSQIELKENKKAKKLLEQIIKENLTKKNEAENKIKDL